MRRASQDSGPQREVDCEIPHRLGGRTKHSYKGVETYPSKRVLKTMKGSPKGKVQRGQYLLAVYSSL